MLNDTFVNTFLIRLCKGMAISDPTSLRTFNFRENAGLKIAKTRLSCGRFSCLFMSRKRSLAMKKHEKLLTYLKSNHPEIYFQNTIINFAITAEKFSKLFSLSNFPLHQD